MGTRLRKVFDIQNSLMKSKYFNYLIPILVLHILGLYAQFISLPENTNSVGRPKNIVLNAQIKTNQQFSVANRNFTPQKNSSKKMSQEQKLPEQISAPISEITSNGAEETDIKKQYFADLKAHIEQHKHYPMISRKLGQTGKVIVAFTLHEDGSFTNIHLHQSCPFERLNVAALDAVKQVGRFRPIPKQFRETYLDIQVPIEYESLN